jgi:hypothetical protein
VSAKAVFQKLRSALESSGVPYFVTGSFASSVHGVPRSTNDIDIVIAPTPQQLSALLEQLENPSARSLTLPGSSACRVRVSIVITLKSG